MPSTDATDSMRQSTLNFDGCAPALRDGGGYDSCSDISCDCSECIANMNDGYTCICQLEGCDFEVALESCDCEICWENRIDEDPVLEFQRPGFFHEHQESAFADAVWRDPHFDDNTMEYYDDVCSSKDLKQFVRQRGLLDVFPAGVTLKYYYLKELFPADRNRVFCFLDLPPELRNEVYGHLLAPRCHYYCYTGILRACKTIHKEATEILYADNVITCSFWSQQTKSERKVRINRRDYSGPEAVEVTQMPTAIDHYPNYLARIRTLKIDIHIDISPRCASTTRNCLVDFVRSGLLALASVVMDGGRLRTIKINVQSSYPLEAEVLASMLYPLRRLRKVEAKIGGDVQMPESLREDMIGDMRLQDPAFNTCKHCRLVLADAETYLALVNLLDPLPTDRAHRSGSSRAALVARQVRYLQSKMTNGRSLFADWLGEVKVQTHLAKLQKQLAEVFPDKMKEMAESMSKTTGDRMEYQQTEDQRWTIGDLARAKSPSPDPAPL